MELQLECFVTADGRTRDRHAGVRYGYRRVHVLLRRDGWRINQKRTRRIYRELGL